MPSTMHEALLSMFKERPMFAAELLTGTLKVKVPRFRKARMASTTFADLAPAEHRADAVVVLEDVDPTLGIVLEVQLNIDWRKRLKWPLYAVGFRAKLGCPTCVLVVTPSAQVAAWASEAIELGPGSWFTPLVLGPAQLPRLTDVSQVAAHPDLAVLSAIAHGKTYSAAEARSVRRTVAKVVGPQDLDRAMLYSDMIFAALSAATRRRFATMDITKYRFKSPEGRWFAAKMREARAAEARKIRAAEAKGVAKGVAEGEARGIAEGRADAVLGVLAARRIPVARGIRQQVLACRDAKVLNGWVRRAAVVGRADEIIERPRPARKARARVRSTGPRR